MIRLEQMEGVSFAFFLRRELGSSEVTLAPLKVSRATCSLFCLLGTPAPPSLGPRSTPGCDPKLSCRRTLWQRWA